MERLKIAIQKKGRLNEGSIEILKKCGISINNGKDQLKVSSSNFPIDLLYLRNSDIPQYVVDGVADIAIVGGNILVEQQKDVEIVQQLGFSKCKVCIAVPKDVEYTGAEYLNGKEIATSYPVTLQQYLDKNNISASIHKISGSVEIAPNIGLAQAICDIVSTGSTLFKNGLKPVETILRSEACLIKNKGLNAEKQEILDKLLFRINAVIGAKKMKYILMNLPNDKIEEVTALLPVLKSPTIMPLAEEGWSSLHTVIEEDHFWDVIDQLKDAGAEGILVSPIEKIVA